MNLIAVFLSLFVDGVHDLCDTSFSFFHLLEYYYAWSGYYTSLSSSISICTKGTKKMT